MGEATLGEDLGDKIAEIGKRRGIFWQSYEIYGGLAGFYDLGPYGVLLKNNLIEEWRRHFVLRHQEMMVEIETPIIGPERLYVASGHVESFTDPIVKCEACGRIYRADHLLEEKLGVKAEGINLEELGKLVASSNLRCPACGSKLSEPRAFNLLFKTQIGPYGTSIGYLRPEAAQGMFVNFKRVYQIMRNRLPLGIAQVGRVARNEISPRQGMVRLREFTIMEFEFFFDPLRPGHEKYIERVADKKLRILTAQARARGETSPEEFTVREAVDEKIIMVPWMAYWMNESQGFLESLGVPLENQYFEEKMPEERAHYSSQTFDQLVKTERWGWIEVSGHAYRTDYDLRRHSEESNQYLGITVPLENPIARRRKILKVDRKRLGTLFRERAAEVERSLTALDLEVLLDHKLRGEPIKLGDLEVPTEAYDIEETEEVERVRRFLPHVVEPSFGCERLLYVTLEYALRSKGDRIILSLPRRLAPVKVAVFPLLSRGPMVSKALELYEAIKGWGYTVLFDESGSIGRRYARADEIGVPVAVTVDYRTLEDDTVTLRDRDSWEQVRISVAHLREALSEFIFEGKSLHELTLKIK
ncbi:MAG: glycine--tRNA ligase [Fervidicoccaceae archaeon]